MKILHFITGLATGGAERMLVKLIRATYKQYDHSVISLREGGSQTKILREMGISVYELDIKGSIPTITSIIHFINIARKEKADVIQGWMYHGNLAAQIACIFKKIPVVWNIRHSLYDIKVEKFNTRCVIRCNAILSNLPDSIIYNSRISSDQHLKLGFNSNKTIIIPNGFSLDKFKPNPELSKETKQELSLPNDKLIVGQVGRNHPMKNHKDFIKAASQVIEERKDVYFILVGKGIKQDSELNSLVRKLDVGAFFTLVGERPDIYKIWNAVDIASLTSSWGEAFPNVIGEAMACEKPCVVTDIGDTAFIVGETGKVVEPNDSIAFADSLLELLNMSEKERKKLGERARQRIKNNFSIDIIKNKYINLYETIAYK